MFGIIIVIHVIACALLILIVMVQQGKGGGLIGSLSSAESIFGTKTNTFLVKSTSVLAVVFFFTCLTLAFLSIQHNKSILTNYKYPVNKTASAKETPKPTAQQAQQEPVKTPIQTSPTQQPMTTAQPAIVPTASIQTTTQNPTTTTIKDTTTKVEKK